MDRFEPMIARLRSTRARKCRAATSARNSEGPEEQIVVVLDHGD
jgi:hypothetical protein